MSDTPRTDRAANESIVRVYETSKQLERELAAAKALTESTGRVQIRFCPFCGIESATDVR